MHRQETKTLEVDRPIHAGVAPLLLGIRFPKEGLEARQMSQKGSKRGLKKTRHFVLITNLEKLEASMSQQVSIMSLFI